MFFRAHLNRINYTFLSFATPVFSRRQPVQYLLCASPGSHRLKYLKPAVILSVSPLASVVMSYAALSIAFKSLSFISGLVTCVRARSKITAVIFLPYSFSILATASDP